MELSINELADLTGRDRRTITKRLASLAPKPGPKGAHLYNSASALVMIYVADTEGNTLDDARKELALEQAALARVNRENAERKRPPLDVVLRLLDETGQAAAAILKTHKNKVLTEAAVNEIFTKFRELPGRLKW